MNQVLKQIFHETGTDAGLADAIKTFESFDAGRPL